MDVTNAAQWIGVGAAMVTSLGAVFGLRTTRRMQREMEARTGMSFELTMDCRVLKAPDRDVILASTLSVVSKSSIQYIIPGAFIDGRPLSHPEGRALAEPMTWESLPRRAPFSTPLDCARKVGPNSLVEVAPGEREVFARWDLIPGAVARQFPVIVVRGLVYFASNELLGEDDRPGGRVGPFRLPWLAYLSETSRQGPPWIPFDRGMDGSKILVDAQGREDVASTAKFREVLATTAACSTFATVQISDDVDTRTHPPVG